VILGSDGTPTAGSQNDGRVSTEEWTLGNMVQTLLILVWSFLFHACQFLGAMWRLLIYEDQEKNWTFLRAWLQSMSSIWIWEAANAIITDQTMLIVFKASVGPLWNPGSCMAFCVSNSLGYPQLR
jgi:hypothetical protein